jgi:hypothetical protein
MWEEEDGEREDISIQFHIRNLTSAILGNDTLRNQKDSLKTTPKPEKISVKQWIKD